MLQTSVSQNALAGAPALGDGVAPAPAPTPLAYGIDDVTRVASIGRTTIFAAIRDGHLRAVKIGRRTLILADDLKSWLEAAAAIQPRIAA